MEHKTKTARSQFTGRIGYVLSVAGSAVGLGNIWRFPYLAAKYGGGIFLLVYLVLLLTLFLHVFGSTLLNWLSMVDNGIVIFLMDLIDLRFFLLLILQSLIFTLMFMVLPNQRNRFVNSLPGGILASIGWLVFSDLFSIYVENFNSYSNIFGSIYAVALGMLWLYCCLSILFYGGALNHYLNQQ